MTQSPAPSSLAKRRGALAGSLKGADESSPLYLPAVLNSKAFAACSGESPSLLVYWSPTAVLPWHREPGCWRLGSGSPRGVSSPWGLQSLAQGSALSRVRGSAQLGRWKVKKPTLPGLPGGLGNQHLGPEDRINCQLSGCALGLLMQRYSHNHRISGLEGPAARGPTASFGR